MSSIFDCFVLFKLKHPLSEPVATAGVCFCAVNSGRLGFYEIQGDFSKVPNRQTMTVNVHARIPLGHLSELELVLIPFAIHGCDRLLKTGCACNCGAHSSTPFLNSRTSDVSQSQSVDDGFESRPESKAP